MKLYFYRSGSVPNFGDELNEWLMPRVFPDFFDGDEATLMLAIGSVLFDHHPKASLKIVFGSGYGGYTAKPVLDENWKVYCVRGPRTAAALNLNKDTVAGDAAMLIRDFRPQTGERRHAFSFIPHFESVQRGNWNRACVLAGVNFIDPRRPVEEVLSEIEMSQTVIAEAMHGAIVADALRVPWIPILPFHPSHHWKWFDWAEALDVKLMHHNLQPSSLREAFWVMASKRRTPASNTSPSIRLQPPPNSSRHLSRPGIKTLVNVVEWGLVHRAASALHRITRVEPTLSSDLALARAVDRLQTNAEKIKRDFSLLAQSAVGDTL